MADLSSNGTRFSVIQPEFLPSMKVLETVNTEKIISNRMSQLVTIWKSHDPPNGAQYDVGGLEFDPIRINQECNTYFELLLRDRVNQACRSVTLAFAVGSDLDAIGSRYPGGIPRLTNESDDRYRLRIWLSVNPLSPHGTAESYKYWALTALDGALRDASAIKIRTSLDDTPVIVVSCLSPDLANPIPSADKLLDIRKYIIDESRMAMTDVVSVSGPKVRQIKYHIRIWIYPGPDQTTVMTAVRSRINELITNQYWLGFDHTRMAISATAAISGVYNVEILEPSEDVIVGPDWVVHVTSVIIDFVGRSE